MNGAKMRSVEIMNLRRLQKLLLGQLTFKSIKQLEKLTNDSFNGDAYEAASSPSPRATVSMDESLS